MPTAYGGKLRAPTPNQERKLSDRSSEFTSRLEKALGTVSTKGV
ncbi:MULTISPECIES: hypothetical protein [unclassified Nostoc]|nr:MULTISPECIES: hypothetical protein [unclassified Nostoc]